MASPMEEDKEDKPTEILVEDKLIVWPPVVVIENAGLGYGPDGKLVGLDNAEIRHIVEGMANVEYRRVVALYDSRGHQGRALVLYPDTDVGYASALTLHTAFNERKRGRDDWYKDSKDKTLEKELYGYLADPSDMRRCDPRKRTVKRWSIESFREKVLKPQQLRPQEVEMAKVHIAEAQQSSVVVQETLDAEEKELERYRQKVAEIEQKLEAEKQKAEALKQEHERMLKERREVFRKQRDEIKNKYMEREKAIREQVMQNKEENQALQAKVQDLESNIEDRKQLQEKLEHLTISRSARQMEMERRRAEIEGRMQEALEAVRATYREKRMKMQREYGRELERMVETQRKKKNVLDQRIKECDEEQKTSCCICLDKLEAPKQKMLYSCGHACICDECFADVWKKNKECPVCRKTQLKKPEAIPAVIYM